MAQDNAGSLPWVVDQTVGGGGVEWRMEAFGSLVGRQLRRIGRYRPVDVAERNVADDSGLRVRNGVGALGRTDADADRAGHVLQDQIREGHVLEARSRAPVELDRAPVDLVQHAI